MSKGQMQGLIGFLVGIGALAVICCIGQGAAMLIEKIVEKINTKGWRK